MSSQKNHWYLHADLDAFFASVEQLDHPEYRGKPVIVGGLPGDLRSVVSTASYEARIYGVHSAMPTKEAYRLCPHGIYIRGNHKRYSEVSWQIMEIFKRFSPDVQQMSIDEAFIDLTGTERLFGPPEETAMKLKAAVKEETGLTISIGLAQTKYFSKLSSGINKPDGFYFMKPGTETNYMLSIPIEKIWGIGKKTADRIKKAGILTTKELYKKELSTLVFLYGENTGNFLYNILRGKAEDFFDSEAKSHSISNERTFSEDLTDIYICETALLELAHSVMFRLLRANLRSRTIVIKIRYEDFTTVSIRQTYSNDIITLDSFFEKVKILFEQKYESMRGIRLLGVGLDNVSEEPATYQQDLFDDSEKKKQAVEQAILKFEKKHPDLPVRKARVYKPKNLILAFLLFSGLFLKPSSAKAEDYTNKKGTGSLLKEAPVLLPLPKEAPSELFDFKVGDSNVDFFVSGYWKAGISGSLIGAFNNFSPFTISTGLPVFKQEVDLNTLITLNNKWYFETAFSDEFKKSTVAFGYNGNGIVKSGRISNRNILYPGNYASSHFGFNPAGGNNQAPGVSLNLSNDRWYSDFILRYDLLNSHNATYYGMNSVTDIEFPISNFISGRFYTLPENFISKIRQIFIENPKGSYTDSSGKKYIKLTKDDYLLDSKNNLLIISGEKTKRISDEYENSILLLFDSELTLSSFISESGSFSSPESFLGKVQKEFDSSGINLEDFYYNPVTEISGNKAFILQSEKKFSPYQNTSFYNTGIKGNSDFYIWSKSLEQEKENFLISDKYSDFLYFYKDLKTFTPDYVKIENKDQSEISERFPFAKTDSQIYLSNNYESDLVLLKREYSSVTQLQISSKAQEGSIRIYRNGIMETGFSFDNETGFINLSKPLKDNEKLYITWSEESNDFSRGAVVIASGFGYNFSDHLNFNTDVTAFIPVSTYEISDHKNVSPLFASLNTGLKYENEKLKLGSSLSVALSKENTSDSLIVYEAGSSIPETCYLSSDAGFNSNSIPELISDNFIFPYDLKTGIKLEQKNNTAKTDKEISGFAVPVEIDFSDITEGNFVWTSKEIKLTDFISGNRFTFALKPLWNKNKNNVSNLDVYLQLGVKASKEEIKVNEKKLPSWKISDANSKNVLQPLDLTKEKWQEVSVQLTEKDLALLTGFHDARIVVVEKNHESKSPSGFILAGPYETETEAFYTKSSKNITVRSSEKTETSSPYSKISNSKKSYSSSLIWNSSGTRPYSVTAGKYFPKCDFSNYSDIEFGIKIEKILSETEESNAFVFTLCQNDGSNLENNGIKAEFNSLALISLNDGKWHKIRINIQEKCIYIDDTKPEKTLYSLTLNKKVLPNYLKFEFNGFSKGQIDFDKVIYSGNKLMFKAQNFQTAEYKNDNALLKSGDFAVVENPYIKAQLLSGAGINAQDTKAEWFYDGTAEGGITLSSIRFEGDVQINSGAKDLITNAGHSVFSSKPLFKILNLNETYSYSESGKNLFKTDSMSLDFQNFHIPLNIKFQADINKENYLENQKYKGQVIFNSSNIFFKTDLYNEQKNISGSNLEKDRNYFEAYKDSLPMQFNSGKENNDRTVSINSFIKGNLNIFSLEPEGNIKIENNSSSNTGKILSEIKFEIPFEFSENYISFSWTKEGKHLLDSFSKNYKDDYKTLFEKQKDMDWKFIGIPFYDLNPDIRPATIDQCSYNGSYEILWKRPFYNTTKDFFIPSAAGFIVSRDFKQLETFTDNYQYKISLSNQSYNIFGKESSISLFKWYNQDEFTSSFDFIIKTPVSAPNETTFALSLYGQFLMYLHNRNTLKGAFDFFLESDTNWNTKETLVYNFEGFHSPLLSLINFLGKENNSLNPNLERTSFLNIEIGKDDKEFFQKYEISHSAEVSFMEHYYLNAGITAGFNHYTFSTDSIVLEFNAGGKITF